LYFCFVSFVYYLKKYKQPSDIYDSKENLDNSHLNETDHSAEDLVEKIKNAEIEREEKNRQEREKLLAQRNLEEEKRKEKEKKEKEEKEKVLGQYEKQRMLDKLIEDERKKKE